MINNKDVASRERIAKCILVNHFNLTANGKYNAILAADSISSAWHYYNILKDNDRGLKVGILYSMGCFVNEKRDSVSVDEDFVESDENELGNTEAERRDVKANSREWLSKAIDEFNERFNLKCSVDNFNEYREQVQLKIREKALDIVVVVNMLLTGFDAPCLNTIYIDKNLKEHSLIQAYSRTNRISDSMKPYGNVIVFRDLREATENAIVIFGEDAASLIFARKYEEVYNGYINENGEKVRGYKEIAEAFKAKYSLKEENRFDEFIDDDDEGMAEYINDYNEFIKVRTELIPFEEFDGEKDTITNLEVQDYTSIVKEFHARLKEDTTGTSKVEVPTIDTATIKYYTSLIDVAYIIRVVLTHLTDDKRMTSKKKERYQAKLKAFINSTPSLKALTSEINEFIREIEAECEKSKRAGKKYEKKFEELLDRWNQLIIQKEEEEINLFLGEGLVVDTEAINRLIYRKRSRGITTVSEEEVSKYIKNEAGGFFNRNRKNVINTAIAKIEAILRKYNEATAF